MFRKYEKTFHASFKRGKRSLSHAEVKRLFEGKVFIEEKMDGSNVGIIRHKSGFHLQKRNSLVGPSEHEQFSYFHAWANRIKYDEIMKIPIKHIVYGELLYVKHNIFYDHLPDYFLVFDVWNGIKKRYLDRDEREEFLEKYNINLEQVPLIYEGHLDFEDALQMVPRISLYADRAEGIVVKRYTKGRQYYKGKIVDPRFHKELDESDHWLYQKVQLNKLVKNEV